MSESGVKLLVRGRNACFTRPEMKVERVSYDVITPSAARGILEAIHWKPAICWVIDRLHVLSPIRFETFRRNEISTNVSINAAGIAMRRNDVSELNMAVDERRQQRSMMCLTNVAYGIEAHFEMTEKAGSQDNPSKHADMFRRRASKGQCFHQPCLGVREFPADFHLVEIFPPTGLSESDRDQDFGWMLHDIEYDKDRSSVFYRARMENGVIDVARCLREGSSS